MISSGKPRLLRVNCIFISTCWSPLYVLKHCGKSISFKREIGIRELQVMKRETILCFGCLEKHYSEGLGV